MSFHVRIRHASLLLLTLVAWLARTALLAEAHEGHQPLPTQGVQVDTQAGLVTLSGQARAAIGVELQEVVVGPVAASLNVYAESVVPWHAQAVGSAQLGGRIVRLLVRPGDWVEKNQVVAELSSRELELVLLDHRQAQNDLALNQRLLEMTKPSALAGAIPMQRLLDIENAVEQSQNRIAIARLQATTLGVALDDTTSDDTAEVLHPIRSPIAGRIVHSDLTEGKYVEAFEHLFDIVNTEEVWAKLQILEKDSLRVKVGHRVKIQFPGLSILAEGVIDQIDVAVEPQTRVSWAWVTLTNQGILPGLPGIATIYTAEQVKRPIVPRRAVHSDGLQNYLFVEQSSTRVAAEYRKQFVRIGTRGSTTGKSGEPMVEILQGDVFPGDRVIVKGGHELSSLFFLGVLKLSTEERERLGIRVETATHRDVALTLQLPGTVSLPPANQSVLTSQVNGMVRSHSLRPGRVVKQGETLMEIASPEFYKLQLDLVSAALEAELVHRRASRLETIQGNAVATRIVLEMRAQAEQLQTRLKSLKRQLSTLGLSENEIDSLINQRRILEYLPVRSSIAGQVSSSMVTLGEVVSANQPLATIHNLDSMWIEAQVPSHETRGILINQSGQVTMLADSSITFDVKLSRMAPTINESTRTQRIWLTPDSTVPVPQLKVGSYASVTLPVGNSTSVLAIPSLAVLRDSAHYVSFVQKSDGAIERRRVVIGRSDGRFTEVVSGISAGESVVTIGGRELQTAYASLR